MAPARMTAEMLRQAIGELRGYAVALSRGPARITAAQLDAMLDAAERAPAGPRFCEQDGCGIPAVAFLGQADGMHSFCSRRCLDAWCDARNGTGPAPAPDAALTLPALRRANVARCEQAFFGLDRWTPLEWAGAMAGEAGEACNKAKKLRRGEDVPAADIADEVADTVIYGDLLCARVGESLEAAVVRKFNEVSRRRGASITLPVAPAREWVKRTPKVFIPANGSEMRLTHFVGADGDRLLLTAETVLKTRDDGGPPISFTVERELVHLGPDAHELTIRILAQRTPATGGEARENPQVPAEDEWRPEEASS